MATTTKKASHQRRDIVVIGASSGGVAALLELARTLPANFPAPIFVVQHVAPYADSLLPQLMNQVSALTVKHAHNGEKVEAGNIYVARPNHHLLVENDTVLVTNGPKENRFRPSIDALFRSAAYSYGPRTIGVVLTGYLDDGTSGLWSIQRLGGLTVVQDPHDAMSPAMPVNALEFVQADHIVPLAELTALLVQLTAEHAPSKPQTAKADLEQIDLELRIAKNENAFELGIIEQGELTPFTCPDCHGALTKLIEGKLIRFRCHTGHAYTISALLSEVTESVESMQYQAMRGLEESKMLLEGLGDYFAKEGRQKAADTFRAKAQKTGRQAILMRELISHHDIVSGDVAPRYPKPKAKPFGH
ncbi:chemotaxis protein CheB [Hymenobacter taeanensis]|uniref:protein-glutamate methylesterase n=1 Tax=Hymenobacter taeanensis TaxID=2735321 RepID=A0A6M6BMI1_9BACT|nr:MULTISPECIES: chemotaxis protein CheB [Hymenobacter]QJX49004.1 chemotaxis protein CheB [Hymenobacter taeanensis]UOQ81480.1 chemotaxis protein CheB [Hymenobacter sp. 5414T-23]